MDKTKVISVLFCILGLSCIFAPERDSSQEGTAPVLRGTALSPVVAEAQDLPAQASVELQSLQTAPFIKMVMQYIAEHQSPLDILWKQKTGEETVHEDFVPFAVRLLYPKQCNQAWPLVKQIAKDSQEGKDFTTQLLNLMEDLDPSFLQLFGKTERIAQVLTAYNRIVLERDHNMNKLEVVKVLMKIPHRDCLMDFLYHLCKPIISSNAVLQDSMNESLAALILTWVSPLGNKLPDEMSTNAFVDFLQQVLEGQTITHPQFNRTYFDEDKTKWQRFFEFLDELYKEDYPPPISELKITDHAGDVKMYPVTKAGFEHLKSLCIFKKDAGPMKFDIALPRAELKTSEIFPRRFQGARNGVYRVVNYNGPFSILSPGTLELVWKSHHPQSEPAE